MDATQDIRRLKRLSVRQYRVLAWAFLVMFLACVAFHLWMHYGSEFFRHLTTRDIISQSMTTIDVLMLCLALHFYQRLVSRRIIAHYEESSASTP